MNPCHCFLSRTTVFSKGDTYVILQHFRECVCGGGERRKSFKYAGCGVVIGSITMAWEGKWCTKRQGLGGEALKGESCGVAR